jgi:flagellar biosynthetic protein FliR
MTLSIGNELALAFTLLLARAASVTMALPSLLGVSIPVQVRTLLALLLAGSLMPLASVAMPEAPGMLPIVILVVREIAIGIGLSFAAAVVVGAVATAGDLIGAGMELNTGAILRGTVVAPNALADGLGALAAILFFIGGFHRALLLGLGESLAAAPLGSLAIPDPHQMLALGGRVFILALEVGLPVMVPLFVLALAQGVIARLAPQVNILLAAPAAIIMAGLALLALDALGIGSGILRAWSSVMGDALRWVNG